MLNPAVRVSAKTARGHAEAVRTSFTERFALPFSLVWRSTINDPLDFFSTLTGGCIMLSLNNSSDEVHRAVLTVVQWFIRAS